MIALLPPLGIQSVECEDGAVYKARPDGIIEIPESFAGERIKAGFVPVLATMLRGEKGDIGDRGEKGIDGASIEGPQGPEGPEGPPGPIGPMPAHEWDGTKLAFELSPGVFGQFVDLKGDRGDRGPMGKQGIKGDDGHDGAPGRPGGGGGGGSSSVAVFNSWMPSGWI